MFTSDRSMAAAALAACVIFGGGCTREPETARPKPPPADYLPAAALTPQPFPEVSYEDVTASSGIAFQHENGAFGKKFLPETMGPGACLLDYDGDELLDVFLVNGRRWPAHEAEYRRPSSGPAFQRLYRNLGGLRFEDATEKAGLAIEIMGMGAAAADVDADGDQDLFVTAVGSNHFFRNEGGRFKEETEAVGLAAPAWTDKDGKPHGSWGTSAAFFDYDRDGRLDLFVANYVRWSPETDIFTTMNGTDKAYTTPELYEGDSCRLYRNTRSKFEDVTKKTNVFRADGKSLGVAIEDLSGDGWPDVFVSNDTQPNFLFKNNGDGTFSEVAFMAGIAYSPDGRARAGMGIDVHCERNTEALSIAIGNFSKEPMSLYRELNRGFFQDDAFPAGVGRATNLCLTFGLLFLDYDLDGSSDLVLVNGHIEPSIQEVQKEVSFAQQPQLFRNGGDGRYLEARKAAGAFFERRLVGRGLAAGDLDGDGDLDLVVTTNGGPAYLLRCDNRTANRGLRLKLRAPGTNRDALGAVVKVTSGGRTQRRCVRVGSSYLSQSELTLTFGLGQQASAEKVAVRWPDGKEEAFQDVAAGAVYRIEPGRITKLP